MTDQSVEVSQRGQLNINERVVDKIASQACLRVPGAVAHSQLLGRSLPRIEAEVAGDKAAMSVDVAVRWPTPVDRFAADVRKAIVEDLLRLTAIEVKRVNVHIAHIELAPEKQRSVA